MNNEIKIYDCKNNDEDVAELERFEQANKAISYAIIYSNPNKVAAYLEMMKINLPRLSELKPHHFNAIH